MRCAGVRPSAISGPIPEKLAVEAGVSAPLSCGGRSPAFCVGMLIAARGFCRAGSMRWATLQREWMDDSGFGRAIDRGFDFPGYHFSRDADGMQALGLAAVTVAKVQRETVPAL
jgi:hypothetical protein